MNAAPFLVVCLLFFGGIGSVAVHREFPDGDTEHKALALLFVIMAVWAAGLLLQPSQTSF